METRFFADYETWMNFMATVSVHTETRRVAFSPEAAVRLLAGYKPKRIQCREGIWEWDAKPVRLTPQQKTILDAFVGRDFLEELALAVRVWGDRFKTHTYIAKRLRALSDVFQNELYFEYESGFWKIFEAGQRNDHFLPTSVTTREV